MEPSQRKPRPGELVEVDVERADARGRLHGTSGPWAVALDRGALGSRVRAEVRKRRRGRLEARVRETLAPGPAAAEPRCRHAHVCGGCSFQETAYAAQLAELRRHVEAALAPPLAAVGHAVEVAPVVGCPEPWGYRNKMDFTFGDRRWVEEHEPDGVPRDFALGLHVPGRFDRVLDVVECAIAPPETAAILASARALAGEHGLEPWSVRAHTGLLRHLVLRKGVRTADLMVHLVTSREEPERIRPYVAELVARHPEITTVVQGINTRLAAVAVGERELVLHGPGTIAEELGGLRFELSATSFFQTNTLQAERLLELVVEAAALAPGEVLWDLYCGTGTLGLALARGAREVWGYEVVADAVRDAERNAARNGIANARFVAGDVLAEIAPERLAETGRPRPDVVVLDPPRAGLHPDVAPRVLALAPRRIVYVSCNPRTAAPDLARFAAAGYAPGLVRPVDLFPHTPHVEMVVALERSTVPDTLLSAGSKRVPHIPSVAAAGNAMADASVAAAGGTVPDAAAATGSGSGADAWEPAGSTEPDTLPPPPADGEGESGAQGRRQKSVRHRPAGLCPACAHVAVVTSDKGSTFLRCALARTDPRFRKYPPQPVLACSGFRE